MKIRTWYVAAGMAALGVLAGCSERAGEAASSSEAAASVSAHEAPIPEAVRQELVRLGMEDQEVRQGLSPERMQDTTFLRSMLRGDSSRTARLRAIVDEHGWPDPGRAGPEAAAAAFLILQHSPVHAFQERMLPVIEANAREGVVPAQEAALLIDRVLMHEDRPQRYGTQFNLEDGRWVLHPVEDPEGLDARRRAMGLPGMEEYMRMLEEAYGAPVVRER